MWAGLASGTALKPDSVYSIAGAIAVAPQDSIQAEDDFVIPEGFLKHLGKAHRGDRL
jgi:hypothetical protein